VTHCHTHNFKMTEVELHHKMSKKCAQLVKVIFNLYVKNDEHQLYHNAQADAYESEIETIVNEANAIINEQNEILARQTQAGDPAEAIAELQQQFDDAKSQAQTELAIVKRRAEERVQQVERSAAEKADEAKREVAEMKKALQRQLKLFEGKQLTSASEWDELRRAPAEEIDNYVKELNAKYNQLLKEKLDLEDKFEEDMAQALTKLNAEWEAKLKQKDAEVREEERERAQSLLDNANQSLLQREEELTMQMSHLQTENSKLEATILELQKEEELKHQIQNLESDLQQSEDNLRQAKHKIDELNEDICKHLDHITELGVELRRQVSIGDDQNAMLNGEITRLKEEIKKSESDWANKLEVEIAKQSSRLEAEFAGKEEALMQQLQQLKSSAELALPQSA